MHCGCGLARRLAGVVGRCRKQERFFEKKQQETFINFGFGLSGEADARFAKVFCCFFLKKKTFLPLDNTMRILVDLSHAADVYVGVAQDLRLIFAMLCDIPGLDVSGLLMPAGRHDLPRLRNGQKDAAAMTASVLQAMERNWEGPEPRPFPLGLLQKASMASQVLRREHALLPAAPRGMGDAIWRVLFARTLAPSMRARVLARDFLATDLSVASIIDWAVHPPAPLHKRLDARGFDAVFFCMPRPVRLPPGVRQIMRFHDAVPVTDADTVQRWRMGLAHSRLVRACDPDAIFVCNSEPSRQTLLSLDPSRETNAVVIPCALSPVWPEDRTIDVCAVIERHLTFRALGSDAAPPGWQAPVAGMRYVLGVSTLEPRKNFPGLVRGWERAAARIGSDLRLVIVGGKGWREEEVLKEMRPGVASGAILHVQGLPQDELQALMRGAACFALPSFNEGFGYAPLEAMQMGTPCVVSDLPVFRGLLGDAVAYADPYDAASIASAIANQVLAVHGGAGVEPLLSRFRPAQVKEDWAKLFERF
jgi:glycosyltransferase involved in cell wall biosynthesis